MGGGVRYLRAGTAEDVIHALGPGLGEEEGLQVAGGGAVVRRLHRVVVLSNTRPPTVSAEKTTLAIVINTKKNGRQEGAYLSHHYLNILPGFYRI